METNVVKERLAFVHDLESGHWSMTELCERYGVTRPTGYKWLARHQAGGGAGLADRSRAPQRCPHRTSDAQEALIIAARLEYGWGAKKLLRVLRTRHPSRAVAGAQYRSTRSSSGTGCCTSTGAGRSGRIPARLPIATQRPNQVWPADFKGQFRTGDGQYCYPLTVTDHFSRRVLACHGLRSVKTVDAKPVFRALFREVGLPDAIRTDNGAPFASTGIHGLAALNVWWMQLGIVHQRITPGESARERHPRADASRAQARDRPPRRQQPARATAPLRRLLSALQRRAAARGDRRPHAECALVPVVAPVPGTPDIPRLPVAPGDPAREHGRHVPPAVASAVPQPRPLRRRHRPRRSRRWHLEHRLLQYVAREDR